MMYESGLSEINPLFEQQRPPKMFLYICLQTKVAKGLKWKMLIFNLKTNHLEMCCYFKMTESHLCSGKWAMFRKLCIYKRSKCYGILIILISCVVVDGDNSLSVLALGNTYIKINTSMKLLPKLDRLKKQTKRPLTPHYCMNRGSGPAGLTA